MNIVFDVDNCLLDFTKSFEKWCVGAVPPNGVALDETSYGLGIERKLLFDLISRWWASDAAGQLEFFPFAVEAFNKISVDHSSMIVSSFPERYREKRVKNLSPLHGHLGIKLLEGDAKKDFIVHVKPDITVEDKPDLIKEFVLSGITVIYPAWQPYCRNFVRDLEHEQPFLSRRLFPMSAWEMFPAMIDRLDRSRQ